MPRGSLAHVEKAPEGRNLGGSTLPSAILAWLMTVAILGGFAFVAVGFFPVNETVLPELVGLTLQDAERRAEAANVTVRTYAVAVPNASRGMVIEQSPPAGTTVKAGRAVSLGVNEPPAPSRMPILLGLPNDAAVVQLRSLSLPAPTIRFVVSSTDPGLVVGQAPLEGDQVAPGTEVILDVAIAYAPFPLELPSVLGLSVEEARSRLRAMGFRSVEALPMEVSTRRPGTVTQQQPQPGTVLAVGEPITLGFALAGAEVARVPVLRGATLAEAGAALRTAGLTVGPIVTVDQPDQPRGVVETRPTGVTLPGSPVTLVVNTAQGVAAEASDRVTDILDALDDTTPIRFEGGVEDAPIDSDSVPPEAQDPLAVEDALADSGAPITQPVDFLAGFEVNGASVDGTPLAAGGGRVIPFEFDPSRLGVASLLRSDYRLRLVVRDGNGERSALEGIVPAGEAVFAQVLLDGDDVLLQTFVNDIFFQAWHP